MAHRDPYAGLLLDGRWMPLTKSIVFVDRPVPELVEFIQGWEGPWIIQRTGCAPRVRRIEGDLRSALDEMLPLVAVGPNKTLFMPTASSWTAVIKNYRGGTDGQMLIGGLAAWGMRAIEIVVAPHTIRQKRTTGGTWGVRKITYVEPSPTSEDPQGIGGWTLGLRTDDSGRWEVSVPDPPPPFPDPTDHSKKRISDRFSVQDLWDVAARFGLRPNEEDFYMPGGWALMIERTDPRDPSWPEFTLEEATGGPLPH